MPVESSAGTSSHALARAEGILRARAGARVHVGYPLAPLTTFRIGGPAALYLEPQGEVDLEAAATAVRETGVPFVVLGKGSNVLVGDDGFHGLVLRLGKEYRWVAREGELLRAGAAMPLPALAGVALRHGLAGLEFGVAIPASLGGAVRMNAGGHGRETVEVLRRVSVADLAAGGRVEQCDVAQLQLGYRRSDLRPSQVVVRAELAVAPRDPAGCQADIDEIVRWRRANQPGGSNAGSVFTNPPGDSAGRLIDACGLKGFAVGGARVSERHANFFQAEPGARAADVVALVLEVQAQVEAETGIRLRPELRRVGFAGQPGARPGATPAWPAESHVFVTGAELDVPMAADGACR